MMMAALMINFGYIGAWKVRTQGAARYSAWRTLAVRTGDWNPVPDNWPASAALTASTGPDLPQTAALWNQPPDLIIEAIRGPLLTAPDTAETLTVEGRLEMDGSVHRGSAQLTRNVPLFRGSMPGGLGQLAFNLTQDLLDHRWQFFSLGIPHNQYPRARVWYDLEHLDFVNLPGSSAQHYSELETYWQKLVNSPDRKHLQTLDQDEEFARYSGMSPDFYPRLSRQCLGDVVSVRVAAVEPYLKEVERLPCTMSQRFLSLYRAWICSLESCVFPDALIDPLRHRYDDLKTFVNGLPDDLKCEKVSTPERCKCEGLNCPPPCPPSPVGVGY